MGNIMQIILESSAQKNKYLSVIQQTIENGLSYEVKYLDFGPKIVRVMCYTPKIIPFLQQQMSFVLRNEADHFDETIVVGQIKDIKAVTCSMDNKFNPKINLRLRVELLVAQTKYLDVDFYDYTFSKTLPLIKCNVSSGFIEAYDTEKHCCYYAVSDYTPEEFIKLGHLFVQQLNVLLKTSSCNLTHGAVFGYQGKGILLCARGQRGKSTLTVHSMLNGCEYVSDDYQLLEQKKDGLYSYPIYSIITLSPQMYHQMYFQFEGKFCSNNGRKDKYVFNISSYHNQFKTNYPIKLCIFPEIVPDETPSIICCSVADKGRAIVQLIHSTIFQMRDLNDHDTIRKLFYMIKDLPFYKFNLCSNITQNTEYLKKFLNNEGYLVDKKENLDRFLLDITYGLANILDTKTFTIYSMNQFATNIYEMLLSGVACDSIIEKLKQFKSINPNILDEFDCLINALNQKHLLQTFTSDSPKINDLNFNRIITCNYKLSLLEFDIDKTIELTHPERKIK